MEESLSNVETSKEHSAISSRRHRGGYQNVNNREEIIGDEIFTNKINEVSSMVENLSPFNCDNSSQLWPSTFTETLDPNKKMDVPSKTPVSVLQEILSRKGMTPKYELLQEEGAIHEPTFRYRVTVLSDLIATGTGRSKKEAKHSAAKSILQKLRTTESNAFFEPQSVNGSVLSEEMNHGGEVSVDNPIGLLQELCMSRRWPPPLYHTEREEGLPHERQFTIACIVFRFKETGTGKSKKVAKRLAAHKMLVCLKGMPCEENNGTCFGLDDEDELAQRLSHLNTDSADLKGNKALMQNLKVSQFHKSLKSSQGPRLCELQSTKLLKPDINSIEILQELAEEQMFTITFVDIEEKSTLGKYQCLIQLSTVPVTVCCGSGDTVEEAQSAAAFAALEYLKLMTQK